MIDYTNFCEFDFMGYPISEPPPISPDSPNINITPIPPDLIKSTNISNYVQQTTSPQTSTRPRTKFTKQEDEIIIRFVKEKGAHSWNRIISLLPGRTPRLVRERWVNYLSPDVNLSPFTKEEDDLLIELVNKNGKHWKFISQSFNKRTDIALKNRYILLKRREKSNLLKQQKLEEKERQNSQPQNNLPLNPVSLLQTDTTVQSQQQQNFQTVTNELSNIDLNTDTESFPTLDDAVACCSEWDADSYQFDDLLMLCDYQF